MLNLVCLCFEGLHAGGGSLSCVVHDVCLQVIKNVINKLLLLLR